MTKQVVIVDANQLVRTDWDLSSPSWLYVLQLASKGEIRLVVPEVVIQETVGKAGEEIEITAKQIRQNIGKLNRLSPNAASDPNITVPGLLDGYNERLRRRLAKHCVEVPPILEVTADLVDRAIKRIRPFNENGNGFRDSLIWMHCLAELDKGENVVLLSSDKAFFENARFHRDLVQEANATAGSASAFKDVDEFLRGTGRYLDDASEFDSWLKFRKQSIELDLTNELVGSDVRITESGDLTVEILNVERLSVTSSQATAYDAKNPFLAVFEFDFSGHVRLKGDLRTDPTQDASGTGKAEAWIKIPQVGDPKLEITSVDLPLESVLPLHISQANGSVRISQGYEHVPGDLFPGVQDILRVPVTDTLGTPIKLQPNDLGEILADSGLTSVGPHKVNLSVPSNKWVVSIKELTGEVSPVLEININTLAPSSHVDKYEEKASLPTSGPQTTDET